MKITSPAPGYFGPPILPSPLDDAVECRAFAQEVARACAVLHNDQIPDKEARGRAMSALSMALSKLGDAP
jgi:hypothetical protein